MQELINSMGEYLTQERIFMLVRASVILVVGLMISRLLAGAAGRMAGKGLVRMAWSGVTVPAWA